MKAKLQTLPLRPADMTERELTKGITNVLREIDASMRRSRKLSEEIECLKQETHRIRAARLGR